MTRRYLVADRKNSQCIIDLSLLDWSRWFTDGRDGELYLHVHGPDESIVRVWCRHSGRPRLEFTYGQLFWLIDD